MKKSKLNDVKTVIVEILFIVSLVLITCSFIDKSLENDTFFTINTGNYILKNGINEIEPFTFHENLKFIKLRWAFDLIVAIIYNFFKFDGIYIFVIIISCFISILLFETLTNLYDNKLVSFFNSIMVIKLLSINLVCRAQIISYFLFALEMFFLEKLYKKNEKKYILFLTIISVFLVNFHSSVWLVFFLPFFTFFAEKICYCRKNKFNFKFKILNKFIIENLEIKYFFIAFLICLLSGILSPLGLNPYTYIFNVMRGFSKEFIVELQQLNLLDNFGTKIIILCGIVLFMFTKIKFKLRDILLIIGFLFMSKLAVRNLYIALIFMVFPITRIMCDLLEQYDLKRITNAIEVTIQNNILAQILLIIGVIQYSLGNYRYIRINQYIPHYEYPIYATEYAINHIDLNNSRVYTDFNYGSYVEFMGIKTFIDSRSEVFCKEFSNVNILEEWYKAKFEEQSYIHFIVNKYNITHLIVGSESSIKLELDESDYYEIMYSDDDFLLYKVKWEENINEKI